MTLEEYVAVRGEALLRFSYLLCNDASLAEETVQDVLADVIPRWPRIQRDVADVDAYMRRAVVNRRNSFWRRRRALPVSEVDQAPAPSPEDGTTERLALWQACLELPIKQRAALVLRYYEDLPYDEIAIVLDCAEGTAKSLVSRAKSSLRPLLSHQPNEV